MFQRRKSKQIQIGPVKIGGDAPVSIQSMTNTDTRDAAATLAQIRELVSAGCEIVRVTVPDEAAVAALPEILAGSPLPVIADIHFDYRLALGSIRAGVHGVRLNPGNIGSAEKVRAVAEAAGEAGIPIRVGANSGSLPKGMAAANRAAGMSHDEAIAHALTDAAMEQVKLLEQYSFRNLKVSLKASSVPVTVAAYRLFAERSDYPLHLGVTEAGTAFRGAVKSAIGIGSLLLDGIGDTIRVSLTGDPVEEVKSARLILKTLGLRKGGVEVVSCPTCGRTQIDLIHLANQVESMVAGMDLDVKVAVMGCVVNGPGEARSADIGIAGGIGEGLLIKKGEIIKKVPEHELLSVLREELLKMQEMQK